MSKGANFIRKHLLEELVYFEEFQLVNYAFYREKYVQGWNGAKREVLINGDKNKLHELSKFKNNKASRLRSKTD